MIKSAGPDGPEAAGPTRRSFLHATAVTATGGSALALAACGTRSANPPSAGGAHTTSNELTPSLPIFAQLLELEHRAIAAYTAGVPLLSGSAHDAARQFLSHQLSHANELAGLIKKGGGVPTPARPNGYDLGNPSGAADVIDLLHREERALIAAYIAAIPRVTPGKIRAVLASMMANEAQHVAIIRSLSGQRAIPAPFFTALQ